MEISQVISRPWNPIEKIAFRFVFLLFVFYIILFNNGTYPLFEWVMEKPLDGMHVFIPWIAKLALHLPYEITVFTNGSGDTTYDYLCLLCVFVLCIIGCILWSLLDRRRLTYDKLYYWLTVLVRFYVALMLINYGLVKIFKVQFPSPGPARLTQTFGNASPMGLAWTFLGFSKGYNIFMGVAEVASVLLLFRRTVTIGSIICLMTTANVMAVNYFYDVPVKIVSTSLFLFSLFLLTPNFRPLIRFFFRGEAAKLNLVPPPLFTRKWVRYSLRIAKILIFVYLCWGIYQSYGMLYEYGDEAPHPPLYGVYRVNSYSSTSPVIPDSARWKKLIVEWPDYAMARTYTDTTISYDFKPDTVHHQIAINRSDRSDTAVMYHLNYIQSKEALVLTGRFGNDSITINMTRIDPRSYRLMSRGFHWINEYPYNR